MCDLRRTRPAAVSPRLIDDGMPSVLNLAADQLIGHMRFDHVRHPPQQQCHIPLIHRGPCSDHLDPLDHAANFCQQPIRIADIEDLARLVRHWRTIPVGLAFEVKLACQERIASRQAS